MALQKKNKSKTPKTPKTQKKTNKPRKVSRKKKWDGKFDKPQVSPWSVDKGDLKYVRVNNADYDKKGKPICPNCGVYNIRIVDYGMSPPTKVHLGKMFFIGVCLTPDCKTVFKYYDTI